MPKRSSIVLRLLFAPLVALSLAACGGTEPQQLLTSVDYVSGDNQVGKVGTTLPDPLVVKAIDDEGDPVRGVPIDWSAPFGNAAVSARRTVTNSDGTTSVRVQLGNVPGNSFIIATQADLGVEVFFTVQGTP